MRFAALAWTLVLLSGAAVAAEVKVYAAGAAKAAVLALAPEFTAATGDTIAPTFDTVGVLRDRVLAGERPDVVILSAVAVEALQKQRLVAPGAPFQIGVVSVSIAVPVGAPLPDVSSSPEALKRALLAAKSIAYADPARGATAGSHFAKVIDRLGLREALADRITVMPFGVEVIEAVAAGRFEMGVSQSSEILQSPGVMYAGPLPSELALSTPYVVAPLAGSEGASKLMDYVRSGRAQAHFRNTGFVER